MRKNHHKNVKEILLKEIEVLIEDLLKNNSLFQNSNVNLKDIIFLDLKLIDINVIINKAIQMNNKKIPLKNFNFRF